MTDITLDTNNDLMIQDGQIPLLGTTEKFVKQRLGIHLKTISGDWFRDVDFGLPRNLLYSKGTQGMLDAAIVEIIVGTSGIKTVTEFKSKLDVSTRIYTVDFSAVTDDGQIITIAGLEIT